MKKIATKIRKTAIISISEYQKIIYSGDSRKSEHNSRQTKVEFWDENIDFNQNCVDNYRQVSVIY